MYYSSDRKKYGFGPLLEPMINELQHLEQQGLDITVNGIKKNIKVTIGQISGDNLGMHGLLGFVESFSSNHPCRFCITDKPMLQQIFYERPEFVRTKEAHEVHVQSDNSVKDTGVTGRSLLSKLEHFHVLDNYTPDIMHDILEGICPYELKLVLHHFILNKLFTIDELNERIRCFNYGSEDSGNKPNEISKSSLISKEGTIKQSASEMWCLTRNLPLIIGDLIPEDDPHWELILSLLHIMSIIFAPAITREATYMLQYLIKDHLESFKHLYPDERIKPKQHYLVHYPRCIRLVGPLVRFWAMRFEAKHNFFRRLSHVMCNFKNICKTMAYRHQYAQCYRFYKKSNIREGEKEIGKGSVDLLANIPHCQEISEMCGLGVHEDVFVANWVKLLGTRYKPGMFVIIDVNRNESLPEFGKILKILVISEEIRFVVEKHNTKYFNRHLNAYSTENLLGSKVQCMLPKNLIDFHPFHQKHSFDSMDTDNYIVMRHQPWY